MYPGPQTGSTGSRAFAAARGDRQALAELGFIVVTIDGMGTPGRSKPFQDAYYGAMGRDNTIPDQMAGMKELAARFPWIDLNRAGIWGHSGGGFATTTAMFRFPDFFKAGIAESGNHDQRLNEDDWGERYQGLVTRGADGNDNYAVEANEEFAKNLQGHLMLAHGTMDTNVPPYQTMLVADALIKANKDFDLLMLPNQNHGYGSASTYMMRRRWDYFVKWLAGVEPPKEYRMDGAPTPPPREPTRADILRGGWGAYRANNRLVSYALDIRVDPAKQSISGRNTIRFRMLEDGTRIQLDLADTLRVDRILLGTTQLKYRARFRRRVRGLPVDAQEGAGLRHRLLLLGRAEADGALRRIHVRQGPGRPALDQHGVRGNRGEHLVAQQGPVARRTRAMRLSVAIPNDLVDVSNGKFLGKTDLGDGYTRWDWLIHTRSTTTTSRSTSEQVVLAVDDRQHPEIVLGEQLGQVVAHVVLLGGNDGPGHQVAHTEARDPLRNIEDPHGRVSSPRPAALSSTERSTPSAPG